ncbi:MAG TPA: hypothetical protein VG694_01550 [Candidatus Paceibacterota bacterium]|nr:hypothetical protein [Candidatus Paceibacterota bacterium]
MATKTEVSPSEKALAFIEKNLIGTEFDAGIETSLHKIKAKISPEHTAEQIREVCLARRREIFERIDKRTVHGSPMERKDEASKYEKGALQGVKNVLVHLGFSD